MGFAAGARLGRYEIVSAIGSGGMGEVYRARDVRLGRDVAIKILPDRSVADENARTRFEREARAVAALNHPHICAVYDVGHDAGHDFLVMELIDGESLDARIRRGPVALPDLLDVGIALADALDAAHARGLIHRDLKPGNIMLTSRGQPKILDFGLVKMIEPLDERSHALATELPISSVGTVVGTVAYMSPEQLRGDVLDHRTDVFSLGLVLYEMATGRRPFTGTATATLAAILTEQPAAPRVLRPDLPPAFDEAILATLAKKREDRCQTAAELRGDLRRIKRDLDVELPRPITGTRSDHNSELTRALPTPASDGLVSDTQVLVALVRRNRWIVAGAILLLAFAAAMVVRSAWPTGASHVGTSDTLDVQAVTVAGDASLGVVSPDGKFVAYVRSQGADRSIWVRQIATQSDVRIVAPEPGRDFVGLTVTPDGNYVDFVAWTAGAASPDLWRIPFLGGTARKIRADVWTAPGWSPDGLQMSFVRVTSDGSESSLVVANADGLNERVIATRRLPLLFDSAYLLIRPVNRPSWSHDGTQIALVGGSTDPSQVDSPAHVVVVNAITGTERKVLAVPHAAVLEVDWRSPTELIVTRGPDARRLQIWRVDLPSGVFSQATHDLAGFRDLTTTADGSIIVSTRENRRAGLSIGTSSGDDVRPALPDTTSFPDDVAVGKDGTLVFSQRSGNSTDLLRLNPHDSNATLLTKGGSEPVLTRDGRTIVFTRLDGLYRVDVDGSHLTALVNGNAFMPDITPDGQTVVFVSTRSGLQSLWSVPTAGGVPTERGHQFAWSPRVSPDGLRLFVGKDPQTATICTLPTCSGGRALTLQNVLPATVHWTPDGRSIAFVRADDPTNIWVQDIESGQLTQLTHFTDRQINNFAWSANGQRLAISRATLDSDVVMIRGLR